MRKVIYYPDQDNLQIQGNYSQGVSGWAIDSDGTAEFNDVVIRGSGYFEGDITGSNGTFNGTVYADKISGGVYDTKYFTGADTAIGEEGELVLRALSPDGIDAPLPVRIRPACDPAADPAGFVGRGEFRFWQAADSRTDRATPARA